MGATTQSVLPEGCNDPDLVLLSFPEGAAAYLGQSIEWVRRRQHTLPGVIIESQTVKKFHPKTYLAKRGCVVGSVEER